MRFLQRIIVALLVVSVSCQRTQLVQETCTYSFVVPRNVDAECRGSVTDDNEALQSRLSQLENHVQDLQSSTSNPPRTNTDDAVNINLEVRLSNQDAEIYQLKRELESLRLNSGGYTPTPINPSNEKNDIYVFRANFTSFSSKFFGVPFSIFCTSNQLIVIQRRTSPFGLSFNRTFQEYKDGFGYLSGEFWLGLDKIHEITSDPRVNYELHAEFRTPTGTRYSLEVPDFRVGPGPTYTMTNSDFTTYAFTSGQSFSSRGPEIERVRLCVPLYNSWWFSNDDCNYIIHHFINPNANSPTWSVSRHYASRPEYDDNIQSTRLAIKPMLDSNT
ncbi:hypothetical protein CAPTEDRAFT_211553 [Capitella teleta]|uniref:Fibrinogen C-terminal domain-containing protein n=1 Tax=Capitella teleta TaxID=283909 RepID=R7TWA4_CAPTE|nr:hypothetical protein CAPTEDRAFT_211553 [Capitella teleta]|eukprot:ELT95726.1 hypothetical protein CAPTEDRAFT_211553 [Capitella teleta]